MVPFWNHGNIMATLTLKQIPDELIQQLREAAQHERRSMNQHAVYLLEQALHVPHQSFGAALERWRRSRVAPEEDTAQVFRGLRSRERGRKVKM
jgi:hypothetical protein